MKNTPMADDFIAGFRQEKMDELDTESRRFTELAKEIALDLLRNPSRHDAEEKRRLAREHLIRSETFKTAATLLLPAKS